MIEHKSNSIFIHHKNLFSRLHDKEMPYQGHLTLNEGYLIPIPDWKERHLILTPCRNAWWNHM